MIRTRERRSEVWWGWEDLGGQSHGGKVMGLLKVMRGVVRIWDQNSDQKSWEEESGLGMMGKTRAVMGSVKVERGPRLPGVSTGRSSRDVTRWGQV